jgi:hypothetical protein
MSNLEPLELKAFVPVHYGDHGSHSKISFLLQRFYVKDVDAFWRIGQAIP